ncbi:HEPN domain-containing protein [Nucisporomicrobium flavum]|uniref:ApeA N-terminal domain 1-containing protein n=1 Tax=Nucisporomicrobium flavum TaxID=2785915 RepID=UPI0018F4355B|nr:HEPN domain-containing protein [Nucisporomicrobium flavum]
MEPLDLLGHFWFPGQPKGGQYGRLTFDVVKGGSLDLNDDLGEFLPNGELHVAWGHSKRRILGTVDTPEGRKKVTLIDCGSGTASRWYVNALLIGDHFDSDSETCFDELILRLDCLPAWVNQDSIESDMVGPLDGIDRKEFELSLTRPPRSEAKDQEGRSVALDFRWGRVEQRLEKLELQQWPQIEIQYGQYAGLDKLSKDISSIYNFVALCVDRAPRFQSIHLYRRDRPELSLEGTPFPGTKRRVELKARFDRFSENRGRRLTPDGVFASFGDVGGIETLLSWLQLADSLGTVVGSLLTMRSQTYTENKFLNQVSAAEGLHRIAIGGSRMSPNVFRALKRHIRKTAVPRSQHDWFNELMSHANDPTLGERLNELASEMPALVPLLVGDYEPWVRLVKKARNLGTHLSETSFGGSPGDLLWLAESVFNFTRASLLLRLGVPLSTLQRLIMKPDVQFATDRCADVVGRLGGRSLP